MEEPGTPNSQAWWSLVDDKRNSSNKRREPLSPNTFASLWTSTSPEEEQRDAVRDLLISKVQDLEKNAQKNIEGAFKREKRSSGKQRRRRSSSGSRKSSSRKQEEDVILSKYYDDKKRIEYQEHESPYSGSPIDRITQQNRNQPTSPAEDVKQRSVSMADDAFDDNASFSDDNEGILDILEDKLCTFEINSPSIAEIEKRIEKSWRDIETRTAQFFQFRKNIEDSTPARAQPNSNHKDEDESERLWGETILSRMDDDPDFHDGTHTTRAVFLSESGDDESRFHSIEPKTRLYPTRNNNRQESDRKEEDMDGDSVSRDTFDLNSYSGSVLKSMNEKGGAVYRVGNSGTMPWTDSADFDASTITTNVPTLSRKSVQSQTSQQSPLEEKEKTRCLNSKAPPKDVPLTIYEPTNSALILQKKCDSNVTEEKETPTSKPTGPPGHNNAPADLDPNFQRRCFSPNLGKKLSPYRTLKSTATSSTVQTSHSHNSSDDTSAGHEEKSHNMYVAFVDRGEEAKKSIQIYDHPVPSSFPTRQHEIIVRVAFSTISHTDCAVRRGKFWGDESMNPVGLPIIPGVAFSGYICQLDRPAIRAGMRYNDRVISLVRVGANARHLCIKRDQVVTVPDELKDDKKVACLPEIYLGAFQVLHMGQRNGARYKKTSLSDKSILILGGATILGKALTELCLAAGAQTVYGTGKERHFQIIESSGATPLNRDPRHWFSILKGRIDLVVGLDNDSFNQSEASAQHLGVLAPGGRAVLFGAPECTCDAKIDDRRRIFVYNVFDSWQKDLKQCKRDLSHLCKLLLEKTIDPNVLETIPLNHIAEVHDAVEHKEFSSFLLCDPWVHIKPEKPRPLSPPGIYGSKGKADRRRSNSHNPPKTLDSLPVQAVGRRFLEF